MTFHILTIFIFQPNQYRLKTLNIILSQYNLLSYSRGKPEIRTTGPDPISKHTLHSGREANI